MQIVISSKKKKVKQGRGMGSVRGDILDEVAWLRGPPWKGDI